MKAAMRIIKEIELSMVEAQEKVTGAMEMTIEMTKIVLESM